MYYRFDEDLAVANVYLTQESDEYLSLISGRPLEPAPKTPLRFAMEVDDDEDGNPVAPALPAFISEGCLMRDDLLAAIDGAGASNLERFPAVILSPDTGEEISSYRVVNILGLVACASVEESRTEPLADGYFFHELVLDPAKVGDRLLFRLAESPSEIIVHEQLAEAIRAGGFPGVTLTPLEERLR
jgi:hypothetical protein